MSEKEPLKIAPALRTTRIQEYYFSQKLKQIAGMRSAGADIINLGIGSPDLPPHPEVVESLYQNALNPANHGYQSYIGTPALREAFAGWYKRYFKVELNPAAEILPLIGSKEGIMHITMAFADEGDEVLIPDPGYPAYSSAALLAGAKVVSYPLKEENGWFPDFDELEARDLSKVKIMWVNYPHMPTGAPAPAEILQKIVDFGRRNRILICNDNPYSFILNDQKISILSVEGAKDICIELNSMSKSHNMAGWRMAMLASNATFISWIIKVKSNVDSGMYRPLMVGAVAALKNTEEWHAEMNRVYARRRELAFAIMDALDCRYDPDQVGMFVWAKIPDRYADSGELADEVLYGRNVFITPGLIFGDRGNRYVRVSLCCTEEMLRSAMLRIAARV